jgi:hypothetical protein
MEVGGNDDLRPVKVIETADPHVDWAAEEGMPLGMVRCYRTLLYDMTTFEVWQCSFSLFEFFSS